MPVPTTAKRGAVSLFRAATLRPKPLRSVFISVDARRISACPPGRRNRAPYAYSSFHRLTHATQIDDLVRIVRTRTKHILIAALCLLGLCGKGYGQSPVYTAPQTNPQTLATNTACTGTPQNFPVNNFGQITHIAQVLPGGSVQTLQMNIQGSTDGTHFVNISDNANGSNFFVSTNAVQAQNYYTVVRVQVTCTPVLAGSNFTLTYAGIAAPSGPNTGNLLLTQIDKQLANQVTANTTVSLPNTVPQTTPFGSSSGTLMFQFVGAGPAGSTLQVQCSPTLNGLVINTFGPFPLSTANAVTQTFQIPAASCPEYTVIYTAGGASASSFNLEYIFAPPGAGPAATQFSHITGTTATAVKATSGFLHTLSVNTGAAGTVSVFDLASASCTGTPSTNTVAVITATTTTLQTFPYDVNLLNGLCVKASVAMDLTVSYQ